MALVLMCTVPSGDHEIAVVRGLFGEQLRLPPVLGSRSLRPVVVHADRPVGQDASRLVYVGCGRNDPQSRPSVFVKDYEEGITRVKGGGYAFLMESTVLQYKVQVSIDFIT